MNQEKMGKFIAKCRKEKNLTQAQLSEMINVGSKTISKWETGIGAPDIFLLEELGKALGVTPMDILNGEKITSNTTKEIMNSAYDTAKFYTNLSKKKSAIKMIKISLGIIILFVFITLGIILKNNYNNCFMYSFTSENSAYGINGILIDTVEKDIVSINSIDLKEDAEIADEKYYDFQYTLNVGKKEVYTSGDILSFSLDEKKELKPLNTIFENIHIFISEDDAYNEALEEGFIKEDFSIVIRYTDEKFELKTINIPLGKKIIFSNNKFSYSSGENF